MNLKESKGNMYEFITHTWNPMGGRCPHGCAYCYMKYHTYIERLYLDERELKGTCPAKLFIFIGSNTDVFAAEMPSAWINKVLMSPQIKKMTRKHVFYFKQRILHEF